MPTSNKPHPDEFTITHLIDLAQDILSAELNPSETAQDVVRAIYHAVKGSALPREINVLQGSSGGVSEVVISDRLYTDIELALHVLASESNPDSEAASILENVVEADGNILEEARELLSDQTGDDS